jgi:hypothetical protein
VTADAKMATAMAAPMTTAVPTTMTAATLRESEATGRQRGGKDSGNQCSIEFRHRSLPRPTCDIFRN